MTPSWTLTSPNLQVYRYRSSKFTNHGQKFTLRLIARLAKREIVTLLCHCAEDAKQCHR